MKASWIFSANDVVINMGVIVAGALVAWTGSNYPDLIIGTVVGFIVLNGARRILAYRLMHAFIGLQHLLAHQAAEI